MEIPDEKVRLNIKEEYDDWLSLHDSRHSFIVSASKGPDREQP